MDVRLRFEEKSYEIYNCYSKQQTNLAKGLQKTEKRLSFRIL